MKGRPGSGPGSVPVQACPGSGQKLLSTKPSRFAPAKPWWLTPEARIFWTISRATSEISIGAVTSCPIISLTATYSGSRATCVLVRLIMSKTDSPYPTTGASIASSVARRNALFSRLARESFSEASYTACAAQIQMPCQMLNQGRPPIVSSKEALTILLNAG